MQGKGGSPELPFPSPPPSCMPRSGHARVGPKHRKPEILFSGPDAHIPATVRGHVGRLRATSVDLKLLWAVGSRGDPQQ